MITFAIIVGIIVGATVLTWFTYWGLVLVLTWIANEREQ